MGGKGGNDAPDPYQQSYRNPALDQLAQQDLTVKQLTTGPDPLLETPGNQASNASATAQTAGPDQPSSSLGTTLPPPKDFTSYGSNLSGLGDMLAAGMKGGQDAPTTIVDDTEEKTKPSATGQKMTTTATGAY